MSIRPLSFAPPYIAVGIVILTTMLAISGCNPAPTSCVFSYSQQHSGNVSTIIWPVDSLRRDELDSYAPNFRWTKSDGTLDSLRGHAGQVVMLNFWATWCGPCTAEMPTIQSISEQMKDSLFIIGVADDACSPWPSVSGYIQNSNIKYQIVLDSEWALYEKYIPEAFGVGFAIPQFIFIGPDGKVRDHESGAGDKDAILSHIYKSR